MATPSGFEPPISTVTGWRARPLHHGAAGHQSWQQALRGSTRAGLLAFRAIEARDTLASMPTTRRRRDPAARRRLPPRPAFATTVAEVSTTAGEDARQRREAERAAIAALRESRYLVAELKRVVGVTATCVAMIVVLAILQRVAQ